jgi:hypothetical protein
MKLFEVNRNNLILFDRSPKYNLLLENSLSVKSVKYGKDMSLK